MISHRFDLDSGFWNIIGLILYFIFLCVFSFTFFFFFGPIIIVCLFFIDTFGRRLSSFCFLGRSCIFRVILCGILLLRGSLGYGFLFLFLGRLCSRRFGQGLRELEHRFLHLEDLFHKYDEWDKVFHLWGWHLCFSWGFREVILPRYLFLFSSR